MKTILQSADDRQLTARAKTLLQRLTRIDADLDSDLEKNRQYEIGAVETLLDILLSGLCRKANGRRYVERQLSEHESWLDDLAVNSDE